MLLKCVTLTCVLNNLKSVHHSSSTEPSNIRSILRSLDWSASQYIQYLVVRNGGIRSPATSGGPHFALPSFKACSAHCCFLLRCITSQQVQNWVKSLYFFFPSLFFKKEDSPPYENSEDVWYLLLKQNWKDMHHCSLCLSLFHQQFFCQHLPESCLNNCLFKYRCVMGPSVKYFLVKPLLHWEVMWLRLLGTFTWWQHWPQ